MLLDHPFHFDGRGRTAATTAADHLRDLIEQVLFTAPGERVMRPAFGSGLAALVFEPNSTVLAATTQMLVQGALQQELSDRIAVQAVDIAVDEGVLRIHVRYTVRDEAGEHAANFDLAGSGV